MDGKFSDLDFDKIKFGEDGWSCEQCPEGVWYITRFDWDNDGSKVRYRIPKCICEIISDHAHWKVEELRKQLRNLIGAEKAK
jgi:hypothetical protein